MLQRGFWAHTVSDQQFDRIQEPAYRLLAEVGLAVHHEQALERLHGIGCRVSQGRVFIPRDVVRWALTRIVPFTTFRSADGTRELGGGRLVGGRDASSARRGGGPGHHQSTRDATLSPGTAPSRRRQPRTGPDHGKSPAHAGRGVDGFIRACAVSFAVRGGWMVG